MSTSTLDRMEDVSLNETTSSSKQELPSGWNGELQTAMDSSNTTTNQVGDQFSTDLLNGAVHDDLSLFQFETRVNDDLFSDQQLPN